jgi:mannose-6-phosphate isomerase-like protein (cupin superfamily)
MHHVKSCVWLAVGNAAALYKRQAPTRRSKEDRMASLKISNEEMMKRIAHFKDVMPVDYSSMNVNPELTRGMRGKVVIGRLNKAAPPVSGAHDFTVAFNTVQPGAGAPLHSHKMVEVFVPMNGKWKFFWGEDGTGEAELGPWDTISFPAGVMEGFKNIGTEEGTLLVILGAPEVGEVTYLKKGAEATA